MPDWRSRGLKRRNKAGARRPSDGLRSSASSIERDRCAALLVLQTAGEITNLQCQPTVHLTRADFKYKADFSYLEPRRPEMVIYEETKGCISERLGTIFKLWPYYGPGELRVVKRRGDEFVVTRSIRGQIEGDE